MNDKDTAGSINQYAIKSMPGKLTENNHSLHSTAIGHDTWSDIRMYLLFIVGILCLAVLSWYILGSQKYEGAFGYVRAIQDYYQKHQFSASVTMSLMAGCNLFWIIINMIIGRLSEAQEWIPKPRKHFIYRESIPSPSFRDKEEIEEKYTKKVAEKNQEDEEEYKVILNTPILSPFAFMWMAVKKTYRAGSQSGQVMLVGLSKFQQSVVMTNYKIAVFLDKIKQRFNYYFFEIGFFSSLGNFLSFCFAQFLLPSIITPLIIYLPVREDFVFTRFWEPILYFVLIGFLRVGVKFYSLYIMFLRSK
jgi:hypothetical protein